MTEYYYDPIYGQIAVDELFSPIVNSFYFRRLRHLRQLGLCYLSFPGGNHTRYEHSLGAFHLSSKLKRTIDSSREMKAIDKERLQILLNLGTLCHDLGHGPFSHMIENALHGEGVGITHEEVGAAIIENFLKNELKPFEDKYNITPKMICQLITKSSDSDPILKCAEELVSSDIDLDRIDYLYRDAHYCGELVRWNKNQINFDNYWELSRHHDNYRFELTETGVNFAEEILILRKNNYRRIVFDSKHMGLTEMFEKAVQIAMETTSYEFGRRCQQLKEIELDWNDTSSVKDKFPEIWNIYGLHDYQAFALLEDCPSLAVKTLIRKIRIGDCFLPSNRMKWEQIHYLMRQKILSLKGEIAAYELRRNIEARIAFFIPDVDPYQIAIHLKKFSFVKPIVSGTVHGSLLEDTSGLSSFLMADSKSNYNIELFLDPVISEINRKKIRNHFEDIFCKGNIDL